MNGVSKLVASSGFAVLLAVTVPVTAAFGPFGKKAGTETEVVTNGPVAECQGRPRASIAISRFDNKVRTWRSYSAGIGDGMADQLTTALVSTGCFKVVDRQNLKGVMDELGLQNSGAVDARTASKIGKLAGADLIITAAITEFSDNSSGSKAGAGAAGRTRLGAIIGGIRGATKTAHMAADLRITDVQTAEIIGATAVKGTARDTKMGGVAGALIPGAAGLGALESWENTPKAAALREVIEHAVSSVRTMIPEGYYRHSAGRFAPKRAAASRGGSGVVRKAQSTLKDLGLYSGVVDGQMGPNTAKAIRMFQEEADIEVTGKLDMKTMKELRNFGG
ncbi:MAG: CsgG/HfaB family protein [Halioglobus sp.]